MLRIELPGGEDLRLRHLVLDVNGTLSDRGERIAGVEERLRRLQAELTLHVLTADTFGTAKAIVGDLHEALRVIETGAEKGAYVDRLGAGACVAIGNGANDAEMLRAARLGIAVLGPEGTSAAAVNAANVLCRSVLEALDLLLTPQALTATLRP